MQIYQRFATKRPQEQQKILKDGEAVYLKACASCHKKEAWGTKDGTFPQLAGQSAAVIIKQLADIRAKNRDNPTMYPYALPKTINDEVPEVGGGSYAIAAVAHYIEQLPMTADPGLGNGKDLERGAKLYADNCVNCHGEHGEGHSENAFPLIRDQHYAYLVRQFEWIKLGKRRNANPDMVKQIAGFSDADTKAVMDYVARLKPADN